jgi:hypothetical protein
MTVTQKTAAVPEGRAMPRYVPAAIGVVVLVAIVVLAIVLNSSSTAPPAASPTAQARLQATTSWNGTQSIYATFQRASHGCSTVLCFQNAGAAGLTSEGNVAVKVNPGPYPESALNALTSYSTVLVEIQRSYLAMGQVGSRQDAQPLLSQLRSQIAAEHVAYTQLLAHL